jgi:methylmalonyl-CoA/ethylmalonyl-CoA epimerase
MTNEFRGPLHAFQMGPPSQVAWVVRDLEEGVSSIGGSLGIGDWNVWNYGAAELSHRSYHHQPGTYESVTAMPAFGTTVEIVQPIKGPSVFLDFLDAGRVGLHHISYFVASIAASEAWFGDRGIEELMRGGGYGLDGDGQFVFYDTLSTLGVYLELVEGVRRRRPPYRTITLPSM